MKLLTPSLPNSQTSPTSQPRGARPTTVGPIPGGTVQSRRLSNRPGKHADDTLLPRQNHAGATSSAPVPTNSTLSEMQRQRAGVAPSKLLRTISESSGTSKDGPDSVATNPPNLSPSHHFDRVMPPTHQ